MATPETPGPAYVVYKDGRREGVELAYHGFDGITHIWYVTSTHDLSDVVRFEIDRIPAHCSIAFPVNSLPPEFLIDDPSSG